MLIETEPCKDCNFSPEYCSCDIDICQITRGKSKPVSEERFKIEKLKEYQKAERVWYCGGKGKYEINI